MQRLLVVGLNHNTAPLPVRERAAFSAAARLEALGQFRAAFPDAEAVLISTCNRVELYVGRGTHGHPRQEEMIRFLAGQRGIDPQQLSPHLYVRTDREAVAHLFSVVCSLDSMVLGETQILGQVREAYEASQQIGLSGPQLNPLFQRAVSAGRQIMTQTALAEGRVSIASIAVDYARRIFDHFSDKTVLCIGAGKMASLVLRSFGALAPRRLLVCNRDPQRATALARQFKGEPAAFEQLHDHLVAADIVISSTGSTHPIVTRGGFEPLLARRRYRPIFLIDIALPRDIEPAVGQIQNVYLYNIDDLQQVVAQTLEVRGGAVADARALVEQHVVEFAAAHRAREIGPVIDRLYQRYHQLARTEVERTIAKLGPISDQEKAHLEELARRIVNKLLHGPLHAIRRGDALHGPANQYLHALERLFQLDQDLRDELPGALSSTTPPPDPEASPAQPAPPPRPEDESAPDRPA